MPRDKIKTRLTSRISSLDDSQDDPSRQVQYIHVSADDRSALPRDDDQLVFHRGLPLRSRRAALYVTPHSSFASGAIVSYTLKFAYLVPLHVPRTKIDSEYARSITAAHSRLNGVGRASIFFLLRFDREVRFDFI